MTTFKGSFISFVVAALLVFDLQAQTAPKFSYELKPHEIQPGERALLEVTLTLPEPLVDSSGEATPPAIRDDLLLNSKLFNPLERGFRQEGSTYIWRYEITAYKNGSISIPPVEIQAGPQSFSTEAQDLTVKSSRKDGDDEIRPELDAVNEPWPWGKWILRVAIVGVLYIGFRQLQKRLKIKAKVPPVVRPPEAPQEDTLEWLNREIARLKAEVSANRSRPESVDDLSKVLRGFYSRVTSNAVEAWTTEEFRARLLKDEKAVQTAGILKLCDHYRFRQNINEPPGDFTLSRVQEAERIFLPWAM